MIYALLWPPVSSRVGVFITLGSIFGVFVALGTLFWMAQPSLFGPVPSHLPDDSLWPLLGPRLLTGAVIELAAVCLILLLLARVLKPR
jgi:hypothetical protein